MAMFREDPHVEGVVAMAVNGQKLKSRWMRGGGQGWNEDGSNGGSVVVGGLCGVT